ncbi:hypothetical protein [Nocardia sp. NPDC003963]
MPELKKILRETACALPAALVVAAVLVVGFGFDGIWVNVVSVAAGIVLGRVVEGGVVLIRAYRAGAARSPVDPGAGSPGA